MVLIEIAFTGGRFHANPWGRHVNEGVAEWPPSPFRFLRALFDAWQRKCCDLPAETVHSLLESLAESLPSFWLPRASLGHTRAFLNSNQRDTAKKQLIFDSFVLVDPADVVMMGWPSTDLPNHHITALQAILRSINYLGRSESWVSCRLLEGVKNVAWNCCAAEGLCDTRGKELLPVACVIQPSRFATHVATLRAAHTQTTKGRKVPQRMLTWIDALTWSSDQVNKARLSQPPAMRLVDYARASDCFSTPSSVYARVVERPVQAILLALCCKVPPRIDDTVLIAERLRKKLMGIHARLIGNRALVSSNFSGKDSSGKPLTGHRHTFILPQDMDDDGRIDHVWIICKNGFDHLEQRAIDVCDSLWQPKGIPDVRLVPVASGTLEQLFAPSRVFVSVTPFVPPRHFRKGRGPYANWLIEELRKEAQHHGLPSIAVIQPLAKRIVQGRELPWWQFKRERKGDSVRSGHGFVIEFNEAVTGPVALGYACHYGLGSFKPQQRQ